MTDPEDLQRRIEKCLSAGGFSQGELLLRRAHRLAGNGSAQDADRLLKEAGYAIDAQRLSGIMEHEPWRLEELLKNPGASV